MNLIVGLVLAPILGWLIRSRRTLFTILTVIWAIGLAPTAHLVLRHDNPSGSLPDTLSFFLVSYVGLGLSLGLAHLVHRRRNRTAAIANVA
jgi:hypothetical protein